MFVNFADSVQMVMWSENLENDERENYIRGQNTNDDVYSGIQRWINLFAYTLLRWVSVLRFWLRWCLLQLGK